MSKDRILKILQYIIYALVAGIATRTTVFMLGCEYCMRALPHMNLVIGCIVLGIVLGSLTEVVFRKPLPLKIILVGVLAIFIAFNVKKLYGGMAIVMNSIFEEIADYFFVDMYFFDMTSKLKAASDPEMFMLLTVTVFSYMYFVSLYRGHSIIAILTVAITYFVPAIIETKLPMWILLADIAVITIYLVRRNGAKIYNVRSGFANAQAILTMAVVTGIIFAIAVICRPETSFRKIQWFDSLKGKIVFSYDDVRDKSIEEIVKEAIVGSSNSNGISEGSIGNVSKIRRTGQVAFTVSSEEEVGTTYLKAFVGANYSSTKWAPVSDEEFIDNRELYNIFMSRMFSSTVSFAEVASNDTSDGFGGLVEIAVTKHFADQYSYIPWTALKVDDEYIVNLSFNERALYIDGDDEKDVKHTYLMVKLNNDSPSYWYQLGQNYMGDARNYQNSVYPYVYADAESIYRTSLVPEYYLEVNTPAGERIKAEILPEILSNIPVSQHNNPGKIAEGVADYLSRNYEYTLSPGKVPEGKDFVEYFLFESKEGFCTYFASSAVMILRSAGIPARYVEGYVVPERLYIQKGDNLVATVTDEQAHAWVEIYIDGVGWMTLEVTKGYSPDYQESSGNPSEASTEESESRTEHQTKPARPDDETEPDINEPSDPDGDSGSENGSGANGGEASDAPQASISIEQIKAVVLAIFKIIYRILLILLPIMLIFAGLRFREKKVEEARNKLYNKDCGLDAATRISRALAYFERLLQYKGIEPKGNISYLEYCEQSGSPVDKDMAAKIEKALYSRECTEDEIVEILKFIKATRDDIYANMKWYKRLFFKYILAY